MVNVALLSAASPGGVVCNDIAGEDFELLMLFTVIEEPKSAEGHVVASPPPDPPPLHEPRANKSVAQATTLKSD